MVIGIINQKGGVGKTTIAVNLADAFCKLLQENVLLVDADPQQSSLSWSDARESINPNCSVDVIGFSKTKLSRDLPLISRKYGVTIIDSAPRLNDIFKSCIQASNMIIIPCLPGIYDVWATYETVEAVKEAMIFNKDLRAYILINRNKPNTILSKDIEEVLKTFELPVLETKLQERVVFGKSVHLGKTIFDVNSDGKALLEIELLRTEVIDLAEKEGLIY